MKISIITATHNRADTLSDTIKSILSQTYKNIEYIIIDGDSSDATIDIIRRWEPLFDGRIRYISEPDNGIYDAMNKGISLATGDIVGILNSDDFYTSNNILERVIHEFTEDNRIDAIYGDVHFVKPDNLDKSVRYYNSKKFKPSKLYRGFSPAHPSFYCKRDVYLKYGLYATDYKISADFDMMVRLFWIHKIKAKYIPIDFVTMRTGGESTKSISSRVLLCKECVRACRKYGLKTNLAWIMTKYFEKIFELCSMNNKVTHRQGTT